MNGTHVQYCSCTETLPERCLDNRTARDPCVVQVRSVKRAARKAARGRWAAALRIPAATLQQLLIVAGACMQGPGDGSHVRIFTSVTAYAAPVQCRRSMGGAAHFDFRY